MQKMKVVVLYSPFDRSGEAGDVELTVTGYENQVTNYLNEKFDGEAVNPYVFAEGVAAGRWGCDDSVMYVSIDGVVAFDGREIVIETVDVD